MNHFLRLWHEASLITLSYFWMALWAFCLGYIISSAIQIFVTRERMRKSMGDTGAKSIGLGTFFGFISSSCSFAALATTRALFQKGAGLAPSLAFLLSSTNLVIELGVVIAIFLGWQFIVGEYVGGLLLILIMIALVKLTQPKQMVKKVRERLSQNYEEEDSEDKTDWLKKARSKEGWGEVASKYYKEWMMVWKDVTVGFTIAGVVSAFVPKEFFQWLFIGTGGTESPGFLDTLQHVLVGPIAAFFTFIGSMGNIPLAAVLFSNGVSFAGIMAFIFSDLVVFPVLRMNAKFYGWKMALYIAGIFFVCIVAASLAMHWGFAAMGFLPEQAENISRSGDRFAIDYTFWMNLVALILTGFFAWLAKSTGQALGTSMAVGQSWIEKLLFVLTLIAFIWLAGGVLAGMLI